MRIVAVSATLPNISDVAEFIGANEAYVFDETFRPVPLTKHVSALGFVGKNEYRFWSSLDRHVPELVQRFSNGKQTLIFCHTKRETEQLAGLLISKNFGHGGARSSSSAPGTVQHCLDNGVAYHHAGMEPSDRRRVEQAFADGKLRCLSATSTLAVGVNLPAHLVIVKGTKTWRGGGQGYQEIDTGSLLQMMGRAGRPGLDTSGVAVIMTDNKSKQSVERLIQGLGPAESRLLPKLVDVINTEISQRVITSLEGALRWLKTTFLFTRLKQEPEKYGLSSSWETMDSYLLHLCNEAIGQLRETGLIEANAQDTISPLASCHIMAQSMVAFESMKLIVALPFDATQCQILKTICKMEPFHLPVRRHEKKPLNECHKTEMIRFKLDGPQSKVRIQDPWEKAFVLLQAYVGQQSFQNYTLSQEMTNMGSTAQRVLVAAQEYSIKGSRNGYVTLMCLKLRRSLHFSLWGESSGVLNQIEGVGQQSTNMLKFHGIVSFQQALSSTEEAIEKASGKPKPFGKQLRSLVSQILREKLEVSGEIEYTRGSNIAAGVVCHVRPSDPATAISEKRRSAVTYTLVSSNRDRSQEYSMQTQFSTISETSAGLYGPAWNMYLLSESNNRSWFLSFPLSTAIRKALHSSGRLSDWHGRSNRFEWQRRRRCVLFC
jgi:ATP-dependent DNA helicase HFM1/MER3